MALNLYNSLTRRKEEFEPLNKGRVGIYVCGPTVYGHAHLGHAKSYVSFDILTRYMRYLGYEVTYVQNITDVGHLTDDADEGEDKIATAAKKENKHPMALAEYYTRSYFEDMDKLNCFRPDISPRASGHILEQIGMVTTLLKKGYAYEANGSVYFDVSKFENYGKLSGRNIDEMIAGARVEVSPDKKNPADFALWKKAERNHIMQWPSPWGMGYPGWHLECSVMSTKYLGKTIDIHGGGLENQFPHHDCEIAQSEATNDLQFVRYWLHNNMVTVDGQKMGKSLNNFITLKQAFSGTHERLTKSYDPLAVRQLILNSHYRSPLDFSDAALFAAQSGYGKITETVKALRKRMEIASTGSIDEEIVEQLKQMREKFEAGMNDDLNTSVGLSVMFELVRLAQSLLEDSRTTKETLNLLDVLFDRLGGDVLGIVKEDYQQDATADEGLTDKLVNILIEQRKDARTNKDFALADQLRNTLDDMGIVLEDKPDMTTWRMK
ncbi:MAG: cysteine--tRNA ligase [Planctomycetes bacterium]|nr:cysteine--tRNA ligase [Planctomycetota bacterium]MBL7144540.1 cysteine--tRNA ligase [Phycisphaerae bacterium]